MIILRSNKILKLPYTLENINKYKSKNNLLRHARFIPGKSEGVFLVDSKTDSLIGYCGWEDNWIVALEVSNEYRRKGFGEKLLDLAISSGCTGLTVYNRNSAAIDLYKKKGFKSTLNNGRRSNMELL